MISNPLADQIKHKTKGALYCTLGLNKYHPIIQDK